MGSWSASVDGGMVSERFTVPPWAKAPQVFVAPSGANL